MDDFEKELNRTIHMMDQAGKAVEIQGEFYKKFWWTLTSGDNPLPADAATALVVGYQQMMLMGIMHENQRRRRDEGS